MGYAWRSIYQGKWHSQTPLRFWHTNGSPKLSQTTKPFNDHQKREKVQICRLCCPSGPQTIKKRKISTSTNMRIEKIWNTKVTIIPIEIGDLGTVTNGLVQGLEDLEISGRVETVEMTALLRSARILRRVLVIWWDLLSLKLQLKIHLITLPWKTLKE